MLLDNDVYRALIFELRDRLNTLGYSHVLIKQSYQPTQQSTPNAPVLFLHKIANSQIGTGLRYNKLKRRQEHIVSATYQVDALAQQDPSDINSFTAGDLVSLAADITQSYGYIRSLVAAGISVEKVTSIRPSYFIDDKGRNELSPSFDLTVTYTRNYEQTVNEVTNVETNIFGV